MRITRCRPSILLAAAVLAAPLGDWMTAQAAEPSVARSLQAADLAWGPCPEFMPQGCSIAVLHGDPSQPNSDIFFKVPGKSEIAEHWHTSAERMVLISGEMSVSYRGQPEVVLKPGMYAYGPAKRPHRAVCTSDEPCVLFIAFELPVDATAGAPPPQPE